MYVQCTALIGVYHAKARAFKHWLSHTEWERRENETYVFSVAKDASLAGDEVSEGELHVSYVYPSLVYLTFCPRSSGYFSSFSRLLPPYTVLCAPLV